MIDTIYFFIGFLIYIGFNILTFNYYSKTPGITKKYILFFIFIYYSMLASYVVYFVDYTGSNYLEVIIQIFIYILAGMFFLYFYFENIISSDD